jgi:hypothetical protein
LHSLGSLAGAAVGSFYPPNRATPIEKGAPIKPVDDEFAGPVARAPVWPSARAIYWLATLGAAILVFLATVASSGGDARVEALFILALFLPAIQLGGALLGALVIGAHPTQRREVAAWKRLGWITLGTVGGCVLGLFIMYLFVAGNW